MNDQTQNRIIFCDIDLARRLEQADAHGGVNFAETQARISPESGATSIPVGSGHAIFVGADSPVTQAFALGFDGEVSPDELTELEDFYRDKKANVNIEVCPLADASLSILLYERGYRPLEQTNVLVRRLPIDDSEMKRMESGVRAREVEPTEAEVWTQTVARGFAETEEMLPLMLDISRTASQVPDTHRFVAEIAGEIVAGGSMGMRDRIASLSGASTLPTHRKRGAQNALLDFRLQYAAAHGCDLATVTTLPGSGSQRNAERWRFQVAYTRTKWLLEIT